MTTKLELKYEAIVELLKNRDMTNLEIIVTLSLIKQILEIQCKEVKNSYDH